MAENVLPALRQTVLSLIPPALTIPAREIDEKWYDGKRKPLLRACMDAVERAAARMVDVVNEVVAHRDAVPPWPSVEAEALVAMPPFVLARFPDYINAFITRTRELVVEWQVGTGKICSRQNHENIRPIWTEEAW